MKKLPGKINKNNMFFFQKKNQNTVICRPASTPRPLLRAAYG